MSLITRGRLELLFCHLNLKLSTRIPTLCYIKKFSTQVLFKTYLGRCLFSKWRQSSEFIGKIGTSNSVTILDNPFKSKSMCAAVWLAFTVILSCAFPGATAGTRTDEQRIPSFRRIFYAAMDFDSLPINIGMIQENLSGILRPRNFILFTIS